MCIRDRNTTVTNAPKRPINAAAHKVAGRLSANKRLLKPFAQPNFLILISVAMAEFYGGSCSLFVQSPVKKPGGHPLESPVPPTPQRAILAPCKGKKPGRQQAVFRGKSAAFLPRFQKSPCG